MNESIRPAIVVVGYNRPDSIKRLLNSISEAFYPVEDVTLIISLDKSDIQPTLIDIAESFEWKHGKKIIKAQKERLGLRKHIISSGDLSFEYGGVIILEDDLFVARDYYNYVYQAINYYSDERRIAGIGLYSHEWNGYSFAPFLKRIGDNDVFAGQFSITWGQCWTARQWKNFKEWLANNEIWHFNNRIPERINKWSNQSWGKYFVSYIVENGLFYIIPNISMSTNFSESGEHCLLSDTSHQVTLWDCVNKKYALGDFDSLFKYDIFFEPVLKNDIAGIPPNQIDVDLNQTGSRCFSRRYRLTTKKMAYKIIASFGLELRPIDKNIFEGITGEGIYLYDLSQKHKKSKLEFDKLGYDIRGYNFIQLYNAAWKMMRKTLYIKAKKLKKSLLRKKHHRTK